MSDRPAGPRCAALVGPYLSGKTTLLEALLFAAGAITRRGTQKDGNTVGDHTPEARARQMSTEINVAHASYLGDPWTFLDCPGSVELAWEAQCAMLVADVAVVVCEPEVERALTLAPIFKFLDDHEIPAHGVHQQARHRRGAGQRGAGGAAVGLGAPAGAAPGAAAGAGEQHRRLCRSRQRARLSLQARARPPTSSRCPRRSPTRSARPAPASSRSSPIIDDKLLEQLLEDVQPSKDEIYRQLDPGSAPRPDRAGVPGRGAARPRRAPPVEGAAPRDARPRPPRPSASASIPASRDTVAQVIKTYLPAAYRQAVAGAGVERAGQRRHDPQRHAASPACCG